MAACEARALVHTAAQALRGGGERGDQGVLEAIERAAQHTGASIGLAALAGVLDFAGADCPSGVPCPITETEEGQGEHHARLVSHRAKTVRTLLGPVEITRGYYHCRACRHGFAPLDTRLGVEGNSLSPGLARAAALAGSEMAYAKGFEFIAAVTGLDLASTSTLARATRTAGRQARELIDAEHQGAAPGPTSGPAPAEVPDKCYVVIDGTGAPVLPREVEGRPGKNGGRASTREVKIGAFFTQTRCDPATGEPTQDPGSVSYISTFDPAASFALQAKAEYNRRGFEAIRQPIILGDGAKWIWNIADTHFPAATQIVDYFHAREHLADLTRLLTPVLTDPAGFERHLIDALDLGQTTTIAITIEDLDLATRAPGPRQTRPDTGRLLHPKPPPHAIRRLPRQRLLHRLRTRRVRLQHHRQTTRQKSRHALDHQRPRPHPRHPHPAPIPPRTHPLAHTNPTTTNLTHTLNSPFAHNCRCRQVPLTAVPAANHRIAAGRCPRHKGGIEHGRQSAEATCPARVLDERGHRPGLRLGAD